MAADKMTVGVLALQGAFIEHEHVLDKLGVEHFQPASIASALYPRAVLLPQHLP